MGGAGGGGLGLLAGEAWTPFLWTGSRAPPPTPTAFCASWAGLPEQRLCYPDDSRQTADVLPALLRQLNYREYVVSTPMETKL